MKGIRWILLAATVLMLSVLACVGGGEEEVPTQEVQQPPTEVPPTPTPAPTNTPQPTLTPEGATIEITNNSGIDVWYVYMSPSKAEQWGEDWLGDTVILDGETYTISGIPEGVYDIKAQDENGNVVEVFWDVELEGPMSWTITGLASLEITNESDDTIVYIYTTPSDSTSWGDDWLGGDEIETGDTYTVGEIPRGTHDIKAADSDDKSIEVIYNVEFAGHRTWTVVGKTPLPDNAVLRFEDDFTDNRNNWGSDTEGEDVFYMRPADGEYCILIKSTNFTAMEWYEPFRTDEFVAEVACYPEGAKDASCGLGFGPDIDNIYWFEVSPSDQTFALFLRENATWQDNLVEWTTSRNIAPGTTNYLSMQRVSGVVSLFVNGVLVSEVDSDLFPTGRVGIGGSTYNEGTVTICLDDLRVWRLE